MSDEIMKQLRDAIVALEDDTAKAVAEKGIQAGIDPVEMINDGIRSALDVMGERFSSGELFLPELMLAAKAAEEAVKILEPKMLENGTASNTLGKVLIATVKGDIHDIGKNIVALLMKSAGFEVVDFGVDRISEEIFEEAQRNAVDVIGLSALLTTTMPRMKEFIELLEESGERKNYKVIVGGAPVTKEFADQIGADGYGADASRAVEVAKELVAA